MAYSLFNIYVYTKRKTVLLSYQPAILLGNPNEKPLFELEDNATLSLGVGVAVPEIYTGTVLLDNSGVLTTRSFPYKKLEQNWCVDHEALIMPAEVKFGSLKY
jgi:hypothetical protein